MLGGLGTWSPILGIVSTIFLPDAAAVRHAQVMAEFRKISYKLDSIQEGISDLGNLVKETAIRYVCCNCDTYWRGNFCSGTQHLASK